MTPLTEEQAIRALRRLAARWPPTIGLLATGTLHVVRTPINAEAAQWVATIDGVPNEGGDPQWAVGTFGDAARGSR